jgi:hypothetical protein
MNFSIKRGDAQKFAAGLATTSMIVVAFAIAGCNERSNPTAPAKQPPGTAETIDPRSKVVGVEPAGPTKETAGTTSIVQSDMTKAEAANAMPMPKQANDHSALLPPTPQKPKAP